MKKSKTMHIQWIFGYFLDISTRTQTMEGEEVAAIKRRDTSITKPTSTGVTAPHSVPAPSAHGQN